MTPLQKRQAFAQAYAAAKPEDRVAALQLLKGAEDDASFLYLVRVCKLDVEPAVRLAAYGMIIEWEDPMGKMERVLLDIFLNEKDRQTKITMCKAFPQLKTKTLVTEQTIKFFNTFSHPEATDRRDRDRDRWNDMNNGGGDGGGGGAGGPVMGRRSAKSIKEAQQQFTEVLGVVNGLTGQSFPSNDNSRVAVKKWWIMNKAEYMKKDAETMKRLEAEARAEAAKKNAANKTAAKKTEDARE